jgi:tetratricopeptide (TPR) repeat protein
MPRLRLIVMVLMLATLAVYLPVRSNAFVYDDYDYIVNNQTVQNGLTWAGLRWAFTTWHSGNWHPLTWISHLLDSQMFGLNAGPQHVVNVLFHSANAALLLLLLFRLTGHLWPSALVAALFAWHPLHVESVAWIAERKDVLSTFFGLLTLLAYARYAQNQSGVERRALSAESGGLALNSRPSTFDYSLALVFFALGLMAKPMLVTLPFVMLLLDLWPLQRFSVLNFQFPVFRRLLWEKWPFFLLLTASCGITFLAQRHGQAIASFEQVPLNQRLENASVAYGLYLLKMIWPANLAVLYPLPEQISGLALAASVAVLAGISIAVWLGRKRSPCLLVGWLWFLGTLVPVIGLVQAGSQALADRYTYFPLIGVFIAVVFGGRQLANSIRAPKAVSWGLAVMVLGACVIITEHQLTYWRNNQSLFVHALNTTRNNFIAHLWVGMALQDEGDSRRALAEYREAARLNPDYLFTHFTLGGLLDKLGRPEEALAEYRRALQIHPQEPAVHDRIGVILVELGHYDEAGGEFRDAAQLDPASPWPHFYLAKALAMQGRDGPAAAEFREAARMEPDNFEILAYAAQLLSASEDPQARDGHTALAYALKANSLAKGTQAFVLDALGMACAETGNFEEAQQAVQKAMALAVAAKAQNLESFRQRLEGYRQHQPWRESFLATNAPPDKSQNP